jgi:hypothetical protein
MWIADFKFEMRKPTNVPRLDYNCILAVELELVQVELGRPKAISKEGQVHWC